QLLLLEAGHASTHPMGADRGASPSFRIICTRITERRQAPQEDPTFPEPITLVEVESSAQRHTARTLLSEYLRWVADIARSTHGLSFAVEPRIESDMEDRTKFFPPSGRFYLVQSRGAFVGVGCLKQLAPAVGEIQRMYVQPHVRGVGAGRKLVEQLLQDA